MTDPNIWFTGGNLGLARFYARFLALQLKCEVSGFPLKVYDRTPGSDTNTDVKSPINGEVNGHDDSHTNGYVNDHINSDVKA